MSGSGSVSLLVKARDPGRLAPTAFGAAAGLVTKPLMPSVAAARRRNLGAIASGQWHQMSLSNWQGSAWDACHALANAPEAALAGVEVVEPDLRQQWINEASPNVRTALAAASCTAPDPQNPKYPHLSEDRWDWYRDDVHGRFLIALEMLGNSSSTVRVAHLDTGYDPNHHALPKNLRTDLAKNFVADPPTDDASDQADGILNNHGHGTGTMSILAGRDPTASDKFVGAAPFVEVVPIRVANRVELFSNGAVAKALDYVHSLCDRDETRIHVVTMSMGGLASQAWADAVNALYDRGVFVVTAAGNNFGNLPTRYIVYPARFKRVVAACGVMEDGRPYADLPVLMMAGNYGPKSKMATAISAYTPNTPWARLGCPDIVDHDGGGTSAATPQVAAAATMWIAKNANVWSGYSKDWMRVEAVRKALFDSAQKIDPSAQKDGEDHFGNGLLKADAALAIIPTEAVLKSQPEDDAKFAFFRVLLGVGAASTSDARTLALELEALQLVQSGPLAALAPDPAADLSRADASRISIGLINDPRTSDALRKALQSAIGVSPSAPPPTPKGKPKAQSSTPPPPPRNSTRQAQFDRASAPPVDKPKRRKLRVFAYDPSLGASLDTLGINETQLDVKWEDLLPGPVGEYLEVIDVDPASKACYAPVDLNNPYLLEQHGLTPSETDPRFHQQMAYAVASRTIEYFERALGRVALWAPHFTRVGVTVEEQYVGRLRIYPHALRAANAYYSPQKKALLLGYFNAVSEDPVDNAPGSLVFSALSHDIVAHETTHALLDGLHRRYTEPTNPDVLAFHEAFADTVALFQHFTLPQALKNQIRRTRGDLGRQNLLGQLAVQFGHATGSYGALRDSIGAVDDAGVWHPHKPQLSDYSSATEPHERGAVLVAALFDAFLQLYKAKTADLLRLATGGTGILPDGAIPADLVDRLAQEAANIAGHCLEICIRALDYCPPIDITFTDYLRALVTADRDIAPEDPLGYRVAFVSAFRARGITPRDVRAISPGSLVWEPPPQPLSNLPVILGKLQLNWDLGSDREQAFRMSRYNAAVFHDWLVSKVSDDELSMLGIVRNPGDMVLGSTPGRLGPVEVHSVRPARRIGPDRRSRAELIVEITQTWRSDAPSTSVFRGGCTLVINLETSDVLYLVRKRVDHQGRYAAQTAFQVDAPLNSLRANYFDDQGSQGETFAALHEAR